MATESIGVLADNASEIAAFVGDVVDEPLEEHTAGDLVTDYSCFCCSSAVEKPLNIVSELVLEGSEDSVSDILQELLAISEVPAGAHLCQTCLNKMYNYYQLSSALWQLRRDMQLVFAQASAAYASSDDICMQADTIKNDELPLKQVTEDATEDQLELNIQICVEDQMTDVPEQAEDGGGSGPGGGGSPATEAREMRRRPAGPCCAECKLQLDSEDALQRHVQAVHRSGPPTYSCRECAQRFHLESELKQHGRAQHDCRRRIPCKHCRRVFRSRVSYLEHLAGHSGERLLQCPVCSEKFARRVCLTVHMKVHRKHGAVQTCESCGDKFATVGRLRTHQQRRHGIEQPWRCTAEDCGKAFGSAAALQVHSVNHTGDRRHACDVCAKRFSTKHRLTAHYRIHTGERPFQCDLCGRQFTHKSNLHQHNTLAHKTERNHKCAECGRAFRRPRELETHRAAAHPSPARLAAGRRTRSPAAGAKQYKCAICQRAFLRLDNLRTHMYIHSEKKPFECRICGLGFLRRPPLLQHMHAASHGDGDNDYVINEAVFVMDAPTGQQGSVSLISAGQHQVLSIVDSSSGGQLAEAGPGVAQIIFKTDPPDRPPRRPGDDEAGARWQQRAGPGSPQAEPTLPAATGRRWQ